VEEVEWGLLACEEWSSTEGYLESALDLLFKETARRGLRVQRYLLDFVTYGYIDDETRANVPAPRMWRGQDATVVLPEEGWLFEDVRKRVIGRLDKMWGVEELLQVLSK
jgi:hypothetical protein